MYYGAKASAEERQALFLMAEYKKGGFEVKIMKHGQGVKGGDGWEISRICEDDGGEKKGQG